MKAGNGRVAGEPNHTRTRDLPASEKFDWSNDDSVVLQLQPATAVYMNKFGAVVIRQEGLGDDEDSFVTFGTVESVHVLIAALKREIGDAS